jgi:hypothetical protein
MFFSSSAGPGVGGGNRRQEQDRHEPGSECGRRKSKIVVGWVAQDLPRALCRNGRGSLLCLLLIAR